MLPSILARQYQEGLIDYIDTSFPITNPIFKGSIRNMLNTKDAVFHEPYVAVRLPFRQCVKKGTVRCLLYTFFYCITFHGGFSPLIFLIGLMSVYFLYPCCNQVAHQCGTSLGTAFGHDISCAVAFF